MADEKIVRYRVHYIFGFPYKVSVTSEWRSYVAWCDTVKEDIAEGCFRSWFEDKLMGIASKKGLTCGSISYKILDEVMFTWNEKKIRF